MMDERLSTAASVRRKAMPGRPFQGGLTIIELAVVLAITAVLVRLAVPMYTNTIASYRLMTEANALIADLQFARSEAIKEGGTSVQMCMSTDMATCSTSATSWMGGYIILDNNGNPLRKQAAFPGTDTMTSNLAVTDIAFNREGFAGGNPTTWNSFAPLSGVLHIKIVPAGSSNLGVCVVVSAVGQVSQIPAGTSDAFGTAC
jgi:type IV fimbrial biogenesis protein FimT